MFASFERRVSLSKVNNVFLFFLGKPYTHGTVQENRDYSISLTISPE
jgi:hypothetical protein